MPIGALLQSKFQIKKKQLFRSFDLSLEESA